MKPGELEELARELLRGTTPNGVEIVKRSPVRIAVIAGDMFLKVFPKRHASPAREARNLRRAAADGLPVPELVASGPGWVATRRLRDLREARREDLEQILALVGRMHALGWVHGDCHLGNFAFAGGNLYVLDLQSARRWLRAPAALRGRDLGFLAYSLGEPLPPELSHARRWRNRRAHTHWRSRTKRCLMESSGFTRWRYGPHEGFRSRRVAEAELRSALDGIADAAPLKLGSSSQLYRSGPWIVKRHSRASMARAAWIGGHGLEMRGVATGRAVAWAGPWLVMEDAGSTLIDWVETAFASAAPKERSEMAQRLAELLARLHRRGIYHADLKANNVAWSPGQEPRLLDYGRVRFRRRVSRRRRVKNLAQLNAALPDTVPPELRDSALDAYLSRSETRSDRAKLRRDVIALSLSREHRWSGC